MQVGDLQWVRIPPGQSVARPEATRATQEVPADVPPIVSGDPKDIPIVMTAVAGKADVLCTLDKHLHEPTVVGFCAGHGVRILRDADLLSELRTV